MRQAGGFVSATLGAGAGKRDDARGKVLQEAHLSDQLTLPFFSRHQLALGEVQRPGRPASFRPCAVYHLLREARADAHRPDMRGQARELGPRLTQGGMNGGEYGIDPRLSTPAIGSASSEPG